MYWFDSFLASQRSQPTSPIQTSDGLKPPHEGPPPSPGPDQPPGPSLAQASPKAQEIPKGKNSGTGQVWPEPDALEPKQKKGFWGAQSNPKDLEDQAMGKASTQEDLPNPEKKDQEKDATEENDQEKIYGKINEVPLTFQAGPGAGKPNPNASSIVSGNPGKRGRAGGRRTRSGKFASG